MYEGMDSQVLDLRAKLSRVTHRASYWKAKVLGIREGSAMKTDKLHCQIELLKDQTSSLDFENAEMNKKTHQVSF